MLRRSVAELGRLSEQLERLRKILWDRRPRRPCRVRRAFVEHRELVQGVRRVLVGLLRRSLEPEHRVPPITRLTELAVEQYHPETIHARRLAQRRGFAKEEDSPRRIPPRAGAALVADRRAVGRRGVVLLRRLDVEVVRLLVINRQPDRAAAQTIGQEELRFGECGLAEAGPAASAGHVGTRAHPCVANRLMILRLSCSRASRYFLTERR